jgi:hypothetical protein
VVCDGFALFVGVACLSVPFLVNGDMGVLGGLCPSRWARIECSSPVGRGCHFVGVELYLFFGDWWDFFSVSLM